jgi:fibronectin-binding autotransporter adhesin
MTSSAFASSRLLRSRMPLALSLALAITACVCPRSLHAQIATWQNTTPGTQDWQLGSNWTTGTAPSAQGATASVIADITAPQTINLNGAVTLGTLTIGDPAATVALYTLASGSNSGRLIFDVASGNAALTQTVSSAANLISAGVTLSKGLVVTNNSESAALTLSGIIIGTGGLTKSGAGTVTLSGANQYSGGTTITAGTLKAGAGEVLSNNGTVTMSGGTLDITGYTETINNLVVNSAAAVTSGTLSSTRGFTVSNGAGVVTISSVLTNPSGATGGLTKSGAGQLTLSAANTYAGPTVVTGGTLKASVGTALPSTTVFSISNATLDLTGVSATVGSFSGTNDVTMTTGTLTATGGYTFATTTGTATINGVLAGSGATLTKSGAGVLLLNGSNTATGAITLGAGTLRLGASERIANGASVVLTGGTFDLATFSETVTSVTGSGNVTIINGTLAANSGFTFNGTSGTATVNAVLNGANLTKSNAGTLELNGANGYTGTTTISGGVLRLGSSERIANSGTISLGAATLDLAGNTETVAAVNITSGTSTITAGTLYADGFTAIHTTGTATINAVLAGAGGLTKTTGAGVLLLNAANTYAGATSLGAGTLRLGTSEAIADTSNVTMTGGVFDLNSFTETVGAFSLTGSGTVTAGLLTASSFAFDTTAATLASAGLSSAGSLTKSGTSTLTLGGSNAFAGGAFVNAGGLTVNGAGATLGGPVTVASGATLTSGTTNAVTGSVTVNSDALFSVAAATTMNSLTLTGGTVSGAGVITATNGIHGNVASGTASLSTRLAGSGSLSKTGAGTLLVGGTNAGWNGTVTLNGGVLQSATTASLGSGTLSLLAGTLSASGSSAVTLQNSEVRFGGNVTLGDSSNAGGLTLSGSGVLVDAPNLAVASAVTLSGPMTGSTGFTKSGGGTLTLNGANTYTGTTTVSAGALILTASAGPGKTGDTRLTGGGLRVGADGALGEGQLQIAGGDLSANGASVTISNTVALEANATFGSGAAGSLTLTGPLAMSGTSRTLNVGRQVTLSGIVSGSAALVKSGNSVLVLTGSGGKNTYSGGTRITDGQLEFSGSDALPDGGRDVTLSGGALVAAGPYVGPRDWLESGRLVANPTGALAITASSTAAAVDFNASYADMGSLENLSLGAATALTYTGSFTPYISGGTPTYNLGGGAGNLNFSPRITDTAARVVVRGDGNGGLILSATNNGFLGGITINSGGILIASATNQLGNVTGSGSNAIVFEGGTFRYSGINRDFSNTFAEVAAGKQAIIDTGTSNVTFATPIRGEGGLYKSSGTGTLTATANYSGATRVNQGVLALTLSNTVTPPTGEYSSTGGTLRLVTAVDRTLGATFSQTNNGNLELSSTSGATLTLSGTINRYTTGTAGPPGSLTVTGGSVVFDGVAADVAPMDWVVSNTSTLVLSSTRGTDQNDSITSVAAASVVRLGASNQILTNIAGLSGRFDLNGYNETLQTIAGSGTVTNLNTGTASTLTLTTTGTLAATLTNASANGLGLVFTGSNASQVLVISNAANSYGGGTTLNAGVLALGANDVLGTGGLTVNGTSTTVQVRSSANTARSFSGPLAIRDAVLLGDASSSLNGALTFSGSTTLQSTSTITGSSAATISGPIGESGSGFGLTKNGAALLVLSGNNTYSGLTTLASGTLRMAGANSSDGGTLVQAGVLQLGADSPLAGGSLQLDGGTVSSDSTTARELVNAITLSGSIVAGNATNNGSLTLAGPMTISGSSRQLNVASAVEISGPIGDGEQMLGFTKLGTGLLTLSGTNTYSGTTAITAGTLLARGVNTSGGATSLAGAVLQLGHDNPLASGTLTFTSGTLSSDGTTARSLSTPTLLAGNVTMGDATNSGGLTFTGGFALSNASTLTTASDVVVNSGITSNNSNRTLTKQGAGTLTINAASTHGGTTLTAGRLRVGAANALGTTQAVTLSGGALSSTGTTARTLGNALTINGNTTIGDVVDSGVMTFTNSAGVSNNPTLTIASDVVMSRFTGTGQTFTKAGNSRITLTGASTMTGTTVLTAGTLFMQSGASLAATSSLVVNNGATLAGTGTAGAVWINDGGTISPGNSPGTSFAGNVTLEAGGNYNWQLYDALGTAGTGWDLISLSNIGLLDLTGLSEANRFNINTWTLSGTGPDVNGAPLNFVYETGTSYRFSVIAVNEISSILLPASLGTPVADMDITSLFTLNTSAVNGTGGWQSPTPAAWNMTVKIGVDGKSIDIIVVPEPATIVLVGIGAALAAAARWRRRPA